MRIADIEVPDQSFREMCRKWKIRRLELFGSARSGRLGPDGDIDLLAEFEADEQWSLMDLVALRRIFQCYLDERWTLWTERTLSAVPI